MRTTVEFWNEGVTLSPLFNYNSSRPKFSINNKLIHWSGRWGKYQIVSTGRFIFHFYFTQYKKLGSQNAMYCLFLHFIEITHCLWSNSNSSYHSCDFWWFISQNFEVSPIFCKLYVKSKREIEVEKNVGKFSGWVLSNFETTLNHHWPEFRKKFCSFLLQIII